MSANASRNPEQCNPDVFKRGLSWGIFDGTKEEAEEFCIQMTRECANYYDWHYVAGRVHVMYLPKDQLEVKAEPEPTIAGYHTGAFA